MPEFNLNISGYATIPHPAERAWVKLAATTSGYNKQTVSDDVLMTAKHIEDQVEALQEKYQATDKDNLSPVAHWSKTSLSSTSRIEYIHQVNKEPKQKRQFTAEINFDIRFRNFEALGEFSAQLSALDHCEVQGIEWRLLPATKKSFESQLRKEAAADALAKAKDYCSVLCAGEDAVCLIPIKLSSNPQHGSFDLGMVQQQAPVNAYSRARRMTAQNGAADSGLAFTPQECRMDAMLDVVFQVQTKGIDIQLSDPTRGDMMWEQIEE